ncbi:MAG TPA: GxxExxY protein [Planctomycetota bacterium]|nr:GxxExxY protein [Planctomycetota bacterium]
MTENEIGKVVVDCAVRMHQELGPGLLESVYEVVLAHELEQRGLRVERQVPVPIKYHGITFDQGFRADIIAEGLVILELKCVESTSKAHKKQVLSYLRLTGLKLGFLLNFGESLLKDGISRIANGAPEEGRADDSRHAKPSSHQ